MLLLFFAELALFEDKLGPVHLLTYIGGSGDFHRLFSFKFVKDITLIFLEKLLVDFLRLLVLVVGSINLGLNYSIASQRLLKN